tara:strand:- start:2181 stop:3116 length:936 start_codon:yes stop_codon:yes gene_type:complete
MKICILPSNHGLGHINRSILIAKYLSDFHNVTIAGNKKKISKFKLSNKIKVINFEAKLKINEKNNTYNQYWYKDLSHKIIKSKYDLFISDNLPEIVHISKNSIIIANFFWHEVFNIKNNLLKKTLSIIKKNKVPIIQNYIYSNKKNRLKMGFLNFPKIKNKKKNSVLLSFGTAKFSKKEIIDEINSINFPKKFKYYFDKKIFEKINFQKNFFQADYKKKMFSELKFAIVKPGFGIVQDCLENNIYMFGITKNMNKEFVVNAKKLEDFKLLKKINSISQGLFLIKREKYKKFFKYKKIKWNGERKILKILNK